MGVKVSRRDFLLAAGLTGAGAAISLPAVGYSMSLMSLVEVEPVSLPVSPALQAGQPETAGPPTTAPLGYAFLSDDEAAFVEAAVSRLIPSDELGPGALEAGVSYFIDHQLAGELGFGRASTWYMQGPFATGQATQGYQLRLDPRRFYQQGIRDVNAATMVQYGRPFAELQPAEQDEVLRGLESGSTELATVPAGAFFSLLRTNTVEGFFADPIYGGNQDKIGWRLIGFPGVPTRGYKELVTEYWNRPYIAEPVSIADIMQGLVASEM
ncbi:MAG: gluconate 2-dehydrogenase subunit 3 family protein [Anaerolineae bacterium]